MIPTRNPLRTGANPLKSLPSFGGGFSGGTQMSSATATSYNTMNSPFVIGGNQSGWSDKIVTLAVIAGGVWLMTRK